MAKIKQLNEIIKPKNYEISLDLSQSDDHIFECSLILAATTLQDSKKVQLHSKDLEIKNIQINNRPTTWKLTNDILTILYPAKAGDDLTIKIDYSGPITDSMHGLYPCHYTYKGAKKYVLATQLESHHAREIFPCIDEPSAKATFDLQIISKTNQDVISNMPAISQTNFDKKLITQFETTPIMSTYLLAFAVGELQKLSGKTKSGVDVNVWSIPTHSKNSLEYALDVATKSIDFYNDYFNVPYPLPKSDHIALPDFSSGAMENWGLITYRESLLLIDESSSIIAKKHVAKTIAHEVAHQWFGNLVTMQWWNDLWLNESFATIMEYVCIDKINNDMNVWDDYSIEESNRAIRRDSIDGVQSVRVEVNHPDEIGTIFDGSIVYAKGGRLLLMLMRYVGENNFKKGLTHYFKTHAYKNTTSDDLWDSISKITGLEVKPMMHTWLDQPGFPIVRLELDGDKIKLSQKQFIVGNPNPKYNRTWIIPLDSPDDTVPKLLDKQSLDFRYKGDGPLIINQNNASHFIAEYDNQLYSKILTAIELDKLDSAFVSQFIQEQTILFREGITTVVMAIELIKATSHSDSATVWQAIGILIADMKVICENDKPTLNKLRKFANTISDELYRSLGWVKHAHDDDNTIKLRDIILGLKGFGRDKLFIKKANELFDKVNGNINNLDPETRPIILKIVVSNHPDRAVIYRRFIDEYPAISSPDVKHDLLTGLCSTRSKSNISDLLLLIKESDFMRPQDLFGAYVGLLAATASRPYAWQWLQLNWMWIQSIFGHDKSSGDFVRYSANFLSTADELKEFRSFFDSKNNQPSLRRNIKMGEFEIKNRIKRINKIGPELAKALKF